MEEPNKHIEEVLEAQKAMRNRSGKVDAESKLVCFLYVLLRDHIQPGQIEDIMLSQITGKPTEFTNGWLAKYAKDVASRLK